MNNSIFPEPLQTGDRVGLIAPAGNISQQQLTTSINNIEALGLQAVYHSSITQQQGYMAGSDSRRLTELHENFSDKSIKAIVCVRGGYGSMRLLPDIDFNIIRSNPKIFMGYSDITALLNTITQETGLLSYHAPMGASVFTPLVKEGFRRFFFHEQTSEPYNHLKDDAYAIVGGKAEGCLCGGNLVLIAALCGTPYEVDMSNKIVFLEEIGEAPYRIDRLLTQLLLSGSLQKAKGILIGDFHNCDAEGENDLSLKEVLRERLAPLNIPVLCGIRAGHTVDNMVLPIGAKVTMDADNCTFLITNDLSTVA